MTNKFCIVIPHYRHHVPLANLLPQLVPYGLPIYIVDDSSGAQSLRAVHAAADCTRDASVVERHVNGGKGAAMMTGLGHAGARGYSHVISLDADGQHDPTAIRHARVCAERHATSIVSGLPVFGADIPAARLHGRKVTNTLVQIEAGSRMIKDAMCGFRVYPLAQTLPLCASIGYRTRMEFDVEILVRAQWAGVPIRYFDTKVAYPNGGESHFRLFGDNTRLVAMHTMLLGQALYRVPRRNLRRFVER